MRVIISSLQVSEEGSKGHLHPAIEIGLALKQRGHHVGILPLPSALGCKDREQIKQCKLELIEPPSLPPGLPLPRSKLAELAKQPTTVAQAFRSFLIAPLEFQLSQIEATIKTFNPDIVVYDLLVYGAPLVARRLGIPDLGYCAGLKLIAPPHLTKIYQTIFNELEPEIKSFLSKHELAAEFHQLELLSATHQLVFTPKEFVSNNERTFPPNTVLAGSLPSSTERVETEAHDADQECILVCFGSVLDPASYPEIINNIIRVAELINKLVIIVSSYPQLLPPSKNIKVYSYLPLPSLLKTAAIFIHHGGANTFSESLTAGVPQLIIPLTTDQPIQATLLKQARAGITINPHEVTEERIYDAFTTLLDKENPLHKRINELKQVFQKSTGANFAADLIEKIAIKGVA